MRDPVTHQATLCDNSHLPIIVGHSLAVTTRRTGKTTKKFSSLKNFPRLFFSYKVVYQLDEAKRPDGSVRNFSAGGLRHGPNNLAVLI